LSPDHTDRQPSQAASAPEAPVALDRYRQIYEGVALPVLMIDAESWLIVAVNRAAVAQYGYPRDEFVGLSALDLRPPEGRAEARKVLLEMPHGFWKTSAVQHCRKDGSLLVVDVWSQDTVVDGRAVRIATISDVTERVQLQLELQQSQKMEAVGRLAGGIAHDFNNSLASIIGNAGLLRESFGDDPAWATELADILRSAERAAALTQQLLAFSRKQVMRVVLVPLNDVVLRAELLLRPAIGGHIDVQTLIAAGTGSVRVDPTQLEQAILTLAVNAQDAMPGGGALVLATRNVSLAGDETTDGSTVPAGDYAEFTMRDTGIGMDDVTRARAFEPFFTTKPPPEGTGLGLSVVYGIVRQCGGFITVDSAVGQGATFRILLPRVEGSAPPPSPSEN